MASELRIHAGRAWIDGAFRPAVIDIADGVIVAITDPGDGEQGDAEPGTAESTGAPATGIRPATRPATVIVPDDAVLLPGLVDSHVHVNEPGRTEWEGFRSATRAAAAGGVTTIVDMPLNSVPPTTSVAALRVKQDAAAASAFVDIGFWGGAVPGNLGGLAPLHEAGVYGFKCFLAPSGVDEFGHLDRSGLEAAMAEIAALGSRLIVHAEDPDHLHGDGALGRGYAGFLASRPPESEEAAIDAVIAAARRSGGRAHVLHLSDGRALPAIRAAKAEGIALTVETCPHYLAIVAEDIPDGASEFKCCPPIREAANQDLLWQGVVDGTIDAIVSDHSPSTVERKRAGDGDFGLAWGGISGLQVGLSAVWTEARTRGIPLSTLIPLFTTGPAAVAGLAEAGRIAVGTPAHLTVFGVDDALHVQARDLRHKNPISAYDGRELTGRIRRTWLRGVPIFDVEDVEDVNAASAAPAGRLLTAPHTERIAV
ncbi:allantoinase AllB [Microbacterium sp. W1N]|uniref:allantoinase AllB n=1 Tax=Microbacterium festucae TaxID=2977531 RepID=UPI0021C0C850|nr:allantoinase AllB [Microbacterium festucae]MCT9819371.1 allantoinase AllB [Microbacterium festucae]